MIRPARTRDIFQFFETTVFQRTLLFSGPVATDPARPGLGRNFPVCRPDLGGLSRSDGFVQEKVCESMVDQQKEAFFSIRREIFRMNAVSVVTIGCCRCREPHVVPRLSFRQSITSDWDSGHEGQFSGNPGNLPCMSNGLGVPANYEKGYMKRAGRVYPRFSRLFEQSGDSGGPGNGCYIFPELRSSGPCAAGPDTKQPLAI
jgi:hypothetical protein